MESLDIKDVETRLQEVMEISVKHSTHIRINSEKGAVVMIPAETYDNLIVTLELLSTPGLLEGFRHVQPHLEHVLPHLELE